MGENLRGRKILQVFVVGHDVNREGRALQVVTPALESLKDSEELLVMSIIVQLGRGQSVRVEHNRLYLVVRTCDGQDTGNCIVQCVGLDCQLSAWQEMGEHGSCSEGHLELVE